MLAAEDEEDVAAMRVTREEMAKEMDEFDEDAPIEQFDESGGGIVAASSSEQQNPHPHPDQSKDVRSALKAAKKAAASDGDEQLDSAPPPPVGVALEMDQDQEASDERDMEREFASWQEKVGPDFRALENALKPVERYALRYRTETDPFYSLFYISEQVRLDAMREEAHVSDQWDVEEIEKEKEEEVGRVVGMMCDDVR